MLIFSTFSLVAGIVVMLLPETRDRPLPDTLQDAVTFLETDKKDCYSFGGIKLGLALTGKANNSSIVSPAVQEEVTPQPAEEPSGPFHRRSDTFNELPPIAEVPDHHENDLTIGPSSSAYKAVQEVRAEVQRRIDSASAKVILFTPFQVMGATVIRWLTAFTFRSIVAAIPFWKSWPHCPFRRNSPNPSTDSRFPRPPTYNAISLFSFFPNNRKVVYIKSWWSNGTRFLFAVGLNSFFKGWMTTGLPV